VEIMAERVSLSTPTSRGLKGAGSAALGGSMLIVSLSTPTSRGLKVQDPAGLPCRASCFTEHPDQ